ncbi:hypothetical conserved integral membrane protein [Streptomyces sulfonofaciens]|uniref:Hypothetical conserved integral membrane protein n=1 Tax=Streptomyces sulfonofaciens TaxID=68272 RepID=A0A919L0P5_9ACTN|nr:hypothetical protein [Streptomyces sulfonofaciens]GHH79149.1 hypothetical conserved integral membrane protein [Streptomyces sulfonofaciens]
MTKVLLSLHVLAAVLAVGPVTVAASMFPGALRRAHGEPCGEILATLGVLHRICRVYAAVGIALLLFGFGTASSLGVLSSPWLIASIVLTFAAAAVLVLLILPAQEDALASAKDSALAHGPGPGSASQFGPGSGSGSRHDSGSALGSDSGSGLRAARRLAMVTGVFNVLWVAVTVLMIVRPGSTTGA